MVYQSSILMVYQPMRCCSRVRLGYLGGLCVARRQLMPLLQLRYVLSPDSRGYPRKHNPQDLFSHPSSTCRLYKWFTNGIPTNTNGTSHRTIGIPKSTIGIPRTKMVYQWYTNYTNGIPMVYQILTVVEQAMLPMVYQRVVGRVLLVYQWYTNGIPMVYQVLPLVQKNAKREKSSELL